MAVPAFANGEGRSHRAARAEEAQAKKDQKDQKAKKDQQESERGGAAARSSSPRSANRGPSASAAKSSNASSKGASASAAKSSKASAKSQGSAAAKGDKPTKPGKPAAAKKQDNGETTAEGENSPAGNKGSMKVRPVGTAAHPPRNYAHLPCTVQVDFYGSPHSGATLTAVSHAPTGPTGQTLLTKTMSFSQPSPNPRGNELVGTTTLDFTSVVSGLTYHEQQGYHVKLTAVQDGPQGGDVKHKVFWIDCPPPSAPVEDAEVGSAGERAEHSDTTKADGASQVDAEPDVAAQVQGLSGQDVTEVRGVTVERETAGPVAGRVLGSSGAVAAVAGTNTRALAATGVGVLTLALLALFGLGGGAEMLRRSRKR